MGGADVAARPYQVVQWTTGNVGAVGPVDRRQPSYELVGCYAWSPEKVGVDVGELAGIAPLGVTATDDVDALLALDPDCVVYNPMWPSTDELERILRAGVNVVSTAAFINGNRLGAERDRLVAACEAGGSSLFGTGVSPGFAELVAVTVAGICNRIDKVVVAETADTTFYDSPDTERPAGGQPIDDQAAGDGPPGGGVRQAVAMVADVLGIQLDDIVCEAEFARTTKDLEMASWTIPAGCVAGVAASWQGRVGDRTVVELSVRWKKGSTLDPDWQIERDGWVIRVEGLPTVTAALDFLPPPDFQGGRSGFYQSTHHHRVPALNAIPAVVATARHRHYAGLDGAHRGWVR